MLLGRDLTGIQCEEHSTAWQQKPKDVHSLGIDDFDRRILAALHADARIPNSALADAVGVAPSTCHGRVRRSFVVDNLNADIDIAGTKTSLILEHLRGAAPWSALPEISQQFCSLNQRIPVVHFWHEVELALGNSVLLIGLMHLVLGHQPVCRKRRLGSALVIDAGATRALFCGGP